MFLRLNHHILYIVGFSISYTQVFISKEAFMRLVVTILLVSFLLTPLFARPAENNRINPPKTPDRIYDPGDPIRDAEAARPAPDDNLPERDPFIGERMWVGDTWYDYQTNGTVGKMIAVDDDGGVYIVWMDGAGENLANSDRDFKHNYLAPGAEEWNWEDGTRVQSGRRGGYGSMALTTEEVSRPLAFCHHTEGADNFTLCGVDWDRGIGAFITRNLPNYPESEVLWPQGIMSNEGRIHIVYNRREGERMLSYTVGAMDENSEPFFPEENPRSINLTHLNSYRIAVSPVSERAAITYPTSRVGIPTPEGWEDHVAYQINNDLMLVWTDDGDEWNFDDPLDVTQIIPTNAEQDEPYSYGDTLRFYCTHDVIFDHDDNIHIVFDARGLWMQAIEQDQPPVDGWTIDASMLYHWDEASQEITPVADGWFTHREDDEEGNFLRWPRPAAWRSNVSNPSLGYDEDGVLYCVFAYHDVSDNSVYDRCNGDLMITLSEDNGATWYEPTRITTTRSHQAEDGQHLSESYPTIAYYNDDYLYITYEMDTEPGTTIQGAYEGVPSLCDWYFHRVAKEDLLREEIFEGTPFHVDLRPIVNDVLRTPGVPVAESDVAISATVRPSIEADLAAVQIEYVVIGEDADTMIVEMENQEEDLYMGTIPGQPEGANVWYRVRAIDEQEVDLVQPAGYWYSYWSRPEGQLQIHDVQYRPDTWSVDYSPYLDYEVTLTGVVTTPPQFDDDYGAFAIQESADYWSGVFVRGFNSEFEVGTLIRITGLVKERDEENPGLWRYLTYIEVTDEEDVEVLGQENPIEPLEVEISEFIYSTNAEDLEGVLVQIGQFEVDTLSEAGNLLGDYYPILSMDLEYEGWFTTYGLDPQLIEDLSIDGYTQGTVVPYMRGVFTENQHYAIAPRGMDDVPPFGEVKVNQDNFAAPQELKFYAAYPNPFNSETRVGFELKRDDFVNLSLYDLNGRLVKQIVEREMRAGYHNLVVNGSALATGVYVLRLDTDQASYGQKIVLVK